jgi:CRISPR system Cascade subunit CasB
MTTATSEHDESSPSAALGAFVGRQAARLWQGYSNDRGEAVSELAVLRRALPRFGVMPQESWGIFARGFPDSLAGHGDEPSYGELAAASALALYAFHQQSRRTRAMHQPGREHSLGRATRTLAGRSGNLGVERRFQALVRASSYDAIQEGVRGIVTQLRGHDIPLDYAALARDLRSVQFAEGVRGVRVRWSRDYYRPSADASASADQTSEETS